MMGHPLWWADYLVEGFSLCLFPSLLQHCGALSPCLFWWSVLVVCCLAHIFCSASFGDAASSSVVGDVSCQGPFSVSFFFPFEALWGLMPKSFLSVCGLDC